MRYSLILSLIASVAALPSPFLGVKTRNKRAEIPTPYTLALKRIPETGRTSSSLLRRTIHQGINDVLSAQLGQDFITTVTFGSETREAVLDTGSSDTWFVETGFTCVNFTSNATIPEAECYFGEPMPRQSSFKLIEDENFNVSYADGEHLLGDLGYEEVTVAGIKIAKQEVALTYLAGWNGDGISSGLLGLAFPSITEAFSGTNASADEIATLQSPNTTNQVRYSSIMNTLFFVENLTIPLFTLALSRDGAEYSSGYGGVIEIGSVPDVTLPHINATSTYTSTAMRFTYPQYINPNLHERQFYIVDVDKLDYKNGSLASATSQAPTEYLVDSGTTLLLVPTQEAASINALFQPPAINQDGAYYVECDAEAPRFGVEIGGQTFFVNEKDMLLEQGPGLPCLSGIQDGGAGPYILGDVFLVNVLAVFDVGSYEMRFAAREHYV